MNLDTKTENIFMEEILCITNSNIHIHIRNKGNLFGIYKDLPNDEQRLFLHENYFAEIAAIEIDKKYCESDFASLQVYIGGSLVWDIPFGMLCKLSSMSIDNDNNSYRISLSNDFFVDGMIIPLLMSKLVYHEVSVILISTNMIPYKLYLKHIFSENYFEPVEPDRYSMQQYVCNKFWNVKNVDLYNNRYFNISDMFIETTFPLQNLSVAIDGFVLKRKYRKNKLDTHIIYKDLWTPKKSDIFNIIMDKLLPYEMINHIEEYIPNTYIYRISIDYSNLLRYGKIGYDTKNHVNKVIIDFGKEMCGNIYCVYNNDLDYRSGMSSARFVM